MVYLQENLNKSMNSLKFVLDNPELCNEFSKYCTVELCIENLVSFFFYIYILILFLK